MNKRARDLSARLLKLQTDTTEPTAELLALARELVDLLEDLLPETTATEVRTTWQVLSTRYRDERLYKLQCQPMTGDARDLAPRWLTVAEVVEKMVQLDEFETRDGAKLEYVVKTKGTKHNDETLESLSGQPVT